MNVRWSRAVVATITLGATLLALGPTGRANAAAVSADSPKVGEHWHMAYGIWNCGSWEKPIPLGEDPIGIHTHGDGLIHIHPFVDEAAGKNAVLGKFLDLSKVKISDTVLSRPGETLKAGASCKTAKGGKAVVRTLLWETRNTKTPKVLTGDVSKLPLRDQEILAFVYGPADAKVGMPPSVAELEDPADLPPPPLTATQLKAIPAPPKVEPAAPDMSAKPPTKLRITDRVVGTGDVAKVGTKPYVRFALYLWRTGEKLDTSSWKAGDQPVAFGRLGKGRLLPGLEKGLVGIKVGGIREITIPPSEGFGPAGSDPVKGDDTMVMIVQLVAVTK